MTYKPQSDTIMEGTAAAIPTCFGDNADDIGRLYRETDTGIVKRWDGNSWEEYAGGGADAAGALVLLEQCTASDSVSLDFTADISSAYDEYVIEIVGIVPATNLGNLRLRCSTDGGLTWDETIGHYAWNVFQFSSVGSGITGSQSAAAISLTYGGINTGVAASGSLAGTYRLTINGSGTIYPRLWGNYSTIYNTGYPSEIGVVGGSYLSTVAINAIRFLMSSGNIASGTVRLYGVAKS